MARFDIHRFLELAGAVKIDDLDWDLCGRIGITPEEAKILRYMADTESHTLLYMRDLLAGHSARDPAITAFLSVWVYEELCHGRALSKALAAAGGSPQLLTDLRAGRERPDPRRVAVVDTIGDLEGVYGLADLVFVGGSLVPHGGQNMLEPAAAGRATLYGPHVENFREEAELLERDGASVRLEGPEGLGATLRDLLGDEQRRARMSRTGMAAVASQTGASRRTLEALLERGLIPVAP